EADVLLAVGPERNRLVECDRLFRPVLPLDGSGQRACDRLRRLVLQGGGNMQVGRLERWAQIRSDKRIFKNDRPCRIERHRKPDAGVAVTNGRKPVPPDGAKKSWTINRGVTAILANTVGDGMLNG